MIRLGTFTRTTNGFFGQITTFLMEDDLSILPIEDPGTENTPDYRVLRGLEDDAIQVGCAGFAIPMQTASAAPFDAYVTEAATRANIPSAWITAVMRAESTGDASAVSPKGAMGLMQIMPDTWRELRATLNLGADPYDPHDNIVAGAAYLRRLHDRYGDMGFLTAYNAGPGRYEQFLTAGKTLPDETKKYVSRVIRLLHGESIGSTISDASFVNQSHAEMPSGNRLFVGPFASQTVIQNAPEVMPVSDHVIRFVAPRHGLFVSVSQRSVP